MKLAPVSTMANEPFPNRLYRLMDPAYANALVERGSVSLASSNIYIAEEMSKARRDNERARAYTPETKHLAMITYWEDKPSAPIRGLRDFVVTFPLPEYHILCLSQEVTETMARQFPGQVCVEIRAPRESFERLNVAVQKQIPWAGIYTGKVTYLPQNKFPRQQHNNLQHMFTKFDCFAYQQEYRVVLSVGEEDPLPKRFNFELRSLRDICRLVDSPVPGNP